MKNIYYISKISSGYYSIHSLIREVFNSPDKQYPSMQKGDLLLISSETLPTKVSPIKFQPIINVSETESEVFLETQCAFDNRHKENIIPKKLNPYEALLKFSKLAGLEITEESHSHFMGPHKEIKFNIHNTFRIYGKFKIKNHKLFNKSLIEGVGSRKSYGFGLIIIAIAKEKCV